MYSVQGTKTVLNNITPRRVATADRCWHTLDTFWPWSVAHPNGCGLPVICAQFASHDGGAPLGCNNTSTTSTEGPSIPTSLLRLRYGRRGFPASQRQTTELCRRLRVTSAPRAQRGTFPTMSKQPLTLPRTKDKMPDPHPELFLVSPELILGVQMHHRPVMAQVGALGGAFCAE